MERIILVRHGQTDKNIEGKLHYVNDEEFLNSEGVKQVKQIVKKLKIFLPSKVYSSKEKRAIESSKIIAEKLGIDFETIEGIQERDFGIFAGQKWAEVEKVLQPMSLEERYLYVPPNGESWQRFENRLIQAITKILQENKGKTIVVVSHGGAIRALMPYLLEASKEESFKHNPDNSALLIFNHNEGNFLQVR